MCIRNHMRVEVQRGLDRSVPQLLLRDLGGYADVVQDRSMNVTQLMPRHALKPCCLCRRPQNAFQKITLAVRSARLVRDEQAFHVPFGGEPLAMLIQEYACVWTDWDGASTTLVRSLFNLAVEDGFR